MPILIFFFLGIFIRWLSLPFSLPVTALTSSIFIPPSTDTSTPLLLQHTTTTFLFLTNQSLFASSILLSEPGHSLIVPSHQSESFYFANDVLRAFLFYFKTA